ncbi:MAG: hypothetical protein AAGK21_01490 [Bacteroidota bacterium]
MLTAAQALGAASGAFSNIVEGFASRNSGPELSQTEYSGRRGIGGGLNYEIAW